MPTVSAQLLNGLIKHEISSEDTVCNEFEKCGTMLPHGCLAGSCGTCKIEIIEGAQNLKPASAIEQNTLDSIYQNYPEAKGKILRLACRAKALGNVTFQPFQGKAKK